MPKSEQGSTSGRYMVIPRTLIFLIHENAVLLIKGAPTKRLWANKYNGIGGHLERGEDVLTAAKRELREETGLESAGLLLAGSVIIDVDNQAGIALWVFKGQYQGGELIESREGSLAWIPLKHLADYPLVEDLPTLLSRVIPFQPGDAPFSARYYYNQHDQLQIVFG